MLEKTPKFNILVVDDTPANLRLLVDLLEEHGYQVRPVPNGKFALGAAQALPPDLILLDIMMPELDGYQVCQQLKSLEKTKDIPVIFISALDEAMDKVRAFSVGAVDYITKPFQVEEILARLATHLELSALQKNLIQKTTALSETVQALKITQVQLIQTEKMAALGQLVAGIAHEINTPMGAIRSSIENIDHFLSNYLVKLPKLFHHFREEDYVFLENLLDLSQSNTHSLSTREKRAIKKEIVKFLGEYNLNDSDIVADTLVDLGMTSLEQLNDLLPSLKTTQGQDILQIAYKISSLKTSSKTILTATEKANKIVFALKNYSRCEVNSQPVYASIIEGIETVITLYHNQLKRGIEISKEYEEIPPIACYPDELNQVWTNLISNAIHAMNNQGNLTIKVQREKENIKVIIADDGSGIKPSLQSRIFEPFFTTKPRGEGTGLGLDIVKKIIDKHHGKIELNSRPGATTFTVLIPINLPAYHE